MPRSAMRFPTGRPLRPKADGPSLIAPRRFANGEAAPADAAIAADDVHSRARDWSLETGAPHFTGNAPYRAAFPASRLNDSVLDDRVKGSPVGMSHS